MTVALTLSCFNNFVLKKYFLLNDMITKIDTHVIKTSIKYQNNCLRLW